MPPKKVDRPAKTGDGPAKKADGPPKKVDEPAKKGDKQAKEADGPAKKDRPPKKTGGPAKKDGPAKGDRPAEKAHGPPKKGTVKKTDGPTKKDGPAEKADGPPKKGTTTKADRPTKKGGPAEKADGPPKKGTTKKADGPTKKDGPAEKADGPAKKDRPPKETDGPAKGDRPAEKAHGPQKKGTVKKADGPTKKDGPAEKADGPPKKGTTTKADRSTKKGGPAEKADGPPKKGTTQKPDGPTKKDGPAEKPDGPPKKGTTKKADGPTKKDGPAEKPDGPPKKGTAKKADGTTKKDGPAEKADGPADVHTKKRTSVKKKPEKEKLAAVADSPALRKTPSCIPSMRDILQDTKFLQARLDYIRLRRRDDLLDGVMEGIIEYINKEDPLFNWKRLNVGSYYENLKINRPDEFDITVEASDKVRDNLLHGFEMVCQISGSTPPGFCGIRFCGPQRQGLKELLTAYRDHHYLSPKKIKERFYNLVREAFDHSKMKQRITIEQPDFTTGASPAVKVAVKGDHYPISIDLVPALVIPWPKDLQWTPQWAKQIVYKEINHLHAVAKTHLSERKMPPEQAMLWRMSFSAMEKSIIGHADGMANKKKSKKTYRKKFMKLMKSFLEFEIVSAYESKNLTEDHRTFCSFHLKNLALDMFNMDKYKNVSAWKYENLQPNLRAALLLLKERIKNKTLFHHFIKDMNLLTEMSLQEERIIIDQIDIALGTH